MRPAWRGGGRLYLDHEKQEEGRQIGQRCVADGQDELQPGQQHQQCTEDDEHEDVEHRSGEGEALPLVRPQVVDLPSVGDEADHEEEHKVQDSGGQH